MNRINKEDWIISITLSTIINIGFVLYLETINELKNWWFMPIITFISCILLFRILFLIGDE